MSIRAALTVAGIAATATLATGSATAAPATSTVPTPGGEAGALAAAYMNTVTFGDNYVETIVMQGPGWDFTEKITVAESVVTTTGALRTGLTIDTDEAATTTEFSKKCAPKSIKKKGKKKKVTRTVCTGSINGAKPTVAGLKAVNALEAEVDTLFAPARDIVNVILADPISIQDEYLVSEMDGTLDFDFIGGDGDSYQVSYVAQPDEGVTYINEDIVLLNGDVYRNMIERTAT